MSGSVRFVAVATRVAASLVLAFALSGALSGAAAADVPAVETHGMGWNPTPGLPRGLSAAVSVDGAQPATPLPQSVDLSTWAAPVGNQGAVGSCASWAVGYYYRYWLRNYATGETALFAPMYLYSQLARGVDNGSGFGDNIQIMQSQGITHRSDYSQGDYDFTTQPTVAEVTAAAPYKVTSGTWLFNGASSQNQLAIESSMASGKPVLLGIPVYDNFSSATAGNDFIDVPSPGMRELGGHALFAAKYDSRGVWVENSWGTGWGDHGWGELSWAFVNQYVDEGWNISADSPNSWAITLASSSATPAGGSAVTLTAAANQGVMGSAYSILIQAADGSVLASCWYGSTCTTSVTSGAGTSLTYHAVVAKSNGTAIQATSDPVSVTWSQGSAAPPGLTYVPMNPVRLLDTRNGTGLSGKLFANTPRTFQVTGHGGVPVDAQAVTGNLTVVNSTFSWAVYLGPDPLASPSTSTINFSTGETTANGLTVALGANGSLSGTYMSTAGNTTDLVFDVTGYFTPEATGATYHPMSPARMLDTRVGNGLGGRLLANTPATFKVTSQGRSGSPIPAGATAVTGNVTVVNETFAWAIYVGPIATATPATSTLNFNSGEVKANNLTVALGPGGTLSLTYMSTAGNTTDLVFDVTGYYTADTTGARYVPLTPARLLDTRVANGLGGRLLANAPATFGVGGRGGVPSNATAVTGNVTVVNETSSWAVYVGPAPVGSPSTSTLNFNKGDTKGNGLTVPLSDGGTLSATFMSSSGNTTDLVLDVTGYFEP